MRKIFVIALMAAVAAFATSAMAASVHFKKGGTPVCTISGGGTSSTSTTCTGSVAGLGGEDVSIEVTVSGFAVYQCVPHGQEDKADPNAPTGQNRVLEGPTTTPTNIASGEIKNGNLTFTTNAAALSASETVSGSAAGCPSSNWVGLNPQLTITTITLDFYQPPGTLVFTCSASNSNGLSGTVTLSNCQFS